MFCLDFNAGRAAATALLFTVFFCLSDPMNGEVVFQDDFRVSPETSQGRSLLLDLQADAGSRQPGGRIEYARGQVNSPDSEVVLQTDYADGSSGALLIRAKGTRSMGDRPVTVDISFPEWELPNDGDMEIRLGCRLQLTSGVVQAKSWVSVFSGDNREKPILALQWNSDGEVIFSNGDREILLEKISGPRLPFMVVIRMKNHRLAGMEILNEEGVLLVGTVLDSKENIPGNIHLTAGVDAEISDEAGFADFRLLSLQGGIR